MDKTYSVHCIFYRYMMEPLLFVTNMDPRKRDQSCLYNLLLVGYIIVILILLITLKLILKLNHCFIIKFRQLFMMMVVSLQFKFGYLIKFDQWFDCLLI